jgi:uncharacterized protein
MPDACLIIFTRYPEPGKVKTRLIPALGAAGAMALHQRMAEQTLAQARAFRAQQPCQIEVWFVGSDTALMQAWLGDDVTFQPQPEGDLGDRMRLAFQAAFRNGHIAVTLVGTDCPELSALLIQQSFEALQHQALTLGPAQDGGYYLIGLQYLIPELFAGIAWSTSDVLESTLRIADRLTITPTLLPTLRDIDVPEDLEHLEFGDL